MPFVRIPTRTHVALSNDPRVTIRGKSKSIGLNNAAYEALGSPAKVELLYDDETDRIALVPTDAAYGVNVRVSETKAGSKSYAVGSRALFQLAGIPEAAFDAALNHDAASNMFIIDVAPLRGLVQANEDGATDAAADATPAK